MIDLVFKLVDELKQLVDVKDKRREKVFEKLIEPVYKELQLVHEDYPDSWREVERMLNGSDDPEQKRQKAIDYLEERRRKLQAVRTKLITYGNLILHDETRMHDNVYRFLSAVIDYIHGRTVWVDTTRYRALISYLEGRRSPFDPTSAVNFVTQVIEGGEESWKEVSKVFTSIQVKTVGR